VEVDEVEVDEVEADEEVDEDLVLWDCNLLRRYLFQYIQNCMGVH